MVHLDNMYASLRRVLSICLALMVSLFWAVSAQAAELGNVHTGADSENVNSISVDSSVDVSSVNEAEARKSVTLNLQTGGNTVTNNTTVKDVSTGDIDLKTEVTAHVNQQSALPGVPSLANQLDVTHRNEHTGANSTNENESTIANTVNSTYVNRATVNESLVIAANTGNNTVANNTTVGNVSTGSITVDVVLDNVINPGPTTPPTVVPTTPPSPNPTTSPSPVTTPTIYPVTSPPRVLAAVGGADIPFAIGGASEMFFPAGAEASSLLGYALLGLWVVLFSTSLVARTRLKGATM